MDNLRTSIEIIFSSNCPDVLLNNQFDKGNTLYSDEILSKSEFKKLALPYLNKYSFDEIENVYQKLDEDWFFDVYKQSKKQSIFYLLTHFNKQVLKETNNEPYVCYEHLLKWRALSFSLGEDIFTCSYLAYMDNRSNRIRNYYAWSPVIFSNNNRLKQMLNKGMAENHFHLKGSAPIFDLSWISLMNNIVGRDCSFNSLSREIKLKSKNSHSFHNHQIDSSISVYKAAYIRCFLFNLINCDSNMIIEENYLKYDSNIKESFEIRNALCEIQEKISRTKYLKGYRFKHKGNNEVADYAIPKDLHNSNMKGTFILGGERQFLYQCFSKIYSADNEFRQYHNLFYAYLLIKNNFRAELIQVNKKVGFSNFSTYQDRKELFIPANSIYETAISSTAINDTKKHQNIKSFEARIAPKNNAIDLNNALETLKSNTDKNSITDYNNIPSDKKVIGTSKLSKEKHFYTIHFIKKIENPKAIDKKNDLAQSILPRHSKLRSEVKIQAKAIVNLRESYSDKSKLIRGIDAASSEFAARPEVFAQAYRYLKDHKLKGKYKHLQNDTDEVSLRATFHAGEDFYDIVDGLRTINEAVEFLKFCQGDRIGHALALGINAKDYFDYKNRRLMMPKEILFDNIVWLLAKTKKYGISKYIGEIERLKDLFGELFTEIYQDNISYNKPFNKVYNPAQFYKAWKLRGDDPLLYLNKYEEDVYEIPNLNYWERCRINYFFPKRGAIRDDKQIKFLYHEYHFNPKIKREGKKIKQFIITSGYIDLVDTIQKHCQQELNSKNIGIETNPTSNYLIGTFDKYEKHPIKEFYNLDLETDSEILNNCDQMFVSINTDDQGVFGTSLENEFALMAISMEKAKDENGNLKYKPTMIYKWLDNIRKMGLQQSFKIDNDDTWKTQNQELDTTQ